MVEKQKKLLIAIIAAAITAGGAYSYLKIKSAEEEPLPPAAEKTMAETLKGLSAPGPGKEVSREILESLTAPGGE